MTRCQIGFVFSNCLFGLLITLIPTAFAQEPTAATPLTPRQKELSRRGDSELAANRPDAAIATWHNLLDTLTGAGDKADVWSRIGEAWRRKGDLAESLRSLQRAAALVPDNALVMTNIGMLYEAQHDPSRARHAYERAIELLPKNPLALNNLALLLSADPAAIDKALTYALRARTLLPESMPIADTVGWIYLRMNKPAEAAELFRTAVAESSDNPEFHYHYAMALHRQGKTAEAARECLAALDHSPSATLRESIRQECEIK
jgi:tetratricopeptide (TPR) repeat protein